MRKFLPFLAIPLLSITFAFSSFAADSASPAKSAGPIGVAYTAGIGYSKEEAAYSKKISDYFTKDAVYRKESWAKRSLLIKQINDAQGKRIVAKTDSEKKALDAQLSASKDQLNQLSEEIAKHEVASAEFGVEIAQHRLEKAKKFLATVQTKK